jgi:hypothetical protein
MRLTRWVGRQADVALPLLRRSAGEGAEDLLYLLASAVGADGNLVPFAELTGDLEDLAAGLAPILVDWHGCSFPRGLEMIVRGIEPRRLGQATHKSLAVYASRGQCSTRKPKRARAYLRQSPAGSRCRRFPILTRQPSDGTLTVTSSISWSMSCKPRPPS